MTTSSTINQTLCTQLIEEITSRIRQRLFGQSEPDIRLLKIAQNVQLGVTGLLGKMIKHDKIQMFITEYVNRYVGAVVRVGEAVGVITAQSLNQPIVQSVLKSQHRTGTKENTATNSLVILNKMSISTRIIKVHPLSTTWLFGRDLLSLTRLFEEVKLDDVLSSTYGNSKYTPEQAGEFYSQDLTYVYINHHHTQVGEIVYRFRMDPSKLDDAGLTPFDIFDILLDKLVDPSREIMIVLHPLSTFIFDIVPGNKPLSAFLELTKKLVAKRLKGIAGLSSISERKIQPSQLVPHSYYDEEKNQTYLYLNASMMTLFPVDELKRRISSVEGEARLISEVTRIHHSREQSLAPTSAHIPLNELFHLCYDGRVVVDKSPYVYYLFMGSLTVKELLDHTIDIIGRESRFGDLIDRRYLVSNDAHEMMDMLGKTAARTIHEYNYSEELRNSETPLLYQHINTVCREMFSLRTNPITPVSYMRSKETNALDKFAYQNYRQNLEREMIRGNRSTNEQIPSAILTGRRAKIGTGYIRLSIDPQRRQEVIELYSEARQRQKYLGDYKDIEIPKLGELRSMTTFTMRPFGESQLPNSEMRGV